MRVRTGQDTAQHAAFPGDVGVESWPVDDDRRRQQFAADDAARLEGKRYAWRGGDGIACGSAELEATQHQPDGFVEPTPLGIDAVGVHRELGIRQIEILRQPRLEKVEIDRPGHQAKGGNDNKHCHADDETSGDTQTDTIESSDQRAMLPGS